MPNEILRSVLDDFTYVIGYAIVTNGYLIGGLHTMTTKISERQAEIDNRKLSIFESETSSQTSELLEDPPVKKESKIDIVIEEIFLAPFWPLRHSKIRNAIVSIPEKLSAICDKIPISTTIGCIGLTLIVYDRYHTKTESFIANLFAKSS